ncbi:MAG: restriction endonuclease subunit S [Alphaproteobacteria bacterium]|nr:restriction endonuclease subunit S [Alphaproteobacteria bacterium]
MGEGALKPGWRLVKFGEVVRLNRDTCKDPVAEGIERVVGLEHLEPGDLRVRTWADVADGTTFTNRVRPGQVLFGKRRAYQRKVAVADFDAICSGDIYVFESADSSRLLPELLPFVCTTDAFFDHAVGTSAGSLSPRTNWSSLKEYEFALPPLEAQARIASLFSAWAVLCDALRDAEGQAASLLRALRESTFGRKSAPISQSPRQSLGEVVADGGVVDGPFGSNLKGEHWTDEGVPVVQGSHISTGAYVVDRPYFVSAETAERLAKCGVRPNDIVMIKKGMSCGSVAVIPGGLPPMILSSNTLRIRPDDSRLRGRFLYHFLTWYRETGRFDGLIGATQQKATTLRDVRRIPVPVPSLREQDEFIEVIESTASALVLLSARSMAAGSELRAILEA